MDPVQSSFIYIFRVFKAMKKSFNNGQQAENKVWITLRIFFVGLHIFKYDS